MKQVLHILAKDARHLWGQVLLVLLLTVTHAILEIQSLPIDIPQAARVNATANIVNMLLPLAIWVLIASLIFQEALPGDRQFWLTRPYHRPKLLASKVLFLFIFVNTPLFISDCCVLGAQGFAVASVLPKLLLRQVPITILFILPSLAIATLTAGLTQFFLAWFILLLAFVFESLFASMITRTHSVGIDVEGGWALLVYLSVVTCSIVIWQYARRQTAAGRLVLIVLALVAFPALFGLSSLARMAFPAHPPHFDAVYIRLAYDPERGMTRAQGSSQPPSGFVTARIPITVAGLPLTTLLRGHALVSIVARGKSWPEPGFMPASSVERVEDEYWQDILLKASKLQELKGQLVNLHSSFELDIVSDAVQTRVPVNRRSFLVPGVGFCRSAQELDSFQFTCRKGLEPTIETDVRLDHARTPNLILATFPEQSLPWGLSPTTDMASSTTSDILANAELAFIPRVKIAALQRTLEAHGVRLEDYILPH